MFTHDCSDTALLKHVVDFFPPTIGTKEFWSNQPQEGAIYVFGYKMSISFAKKISVEKPLKTFLILLLIL